MRVCVCVMIIRYLIVISNVMYHKMALDEGAIKLCYLFINTNTHRIKEI